MADKKVGEQFYSRPPIIGKWEGFKLFLWNSETSQFLGRTGSSWAKILFFYVCFYAALVGFFAAMLAVFYQTLDSKTPKWQMNEGLIGSNPGLGFRPMPPESNVESTLIWYQSNNEKNYKYWVDEIDRFISETYAEDKLNHSNAYNCIGSEKPPEGRFCKVTLQSFQTCHKSHDFGFGLKQPCIFLKLNKIFNWEPEIYNTSKNLPEKMPADLKDHIKEMEATGSHNTNLVWVSCEGENPADNENIGAINYFPHRGFPANFFPFKNVEGYVPPIVAVKFEGPATGVLINIECKAWAGNIHHDRADRRGSVHFELMVD